MQIIQARFDGHTFALSAASDLTDVKQRILEAVRHGAGFVDIETAGGRNLSVLVTPAIPVRLEVFEIDEVDESEGEQEPPSFDQFEIFDYTDLAV